MRTVLTLFAVIGLAVLGAAPASAGGPTSVLLTAPSKERAAAIYYTDSAYTQLTGMLDGGPAAQARPESDSGTYITATWLIHDTSVWRTDHIHLTDAGPVIETRTIGPEGGGIWDVAPVWHTSKEPLALMALLDTLRLVAGSPAAERPTADQVVDTATVPAAATVATTQDSRWEWGIGGLLAGVLLALAIRRIPGLRRASTG